MRHSILFAALMAICSAANAGFITVDNLTPSESSTGVVSNNNYQSLLAGEGVTDYTFGGSLAVDSAGWVDFYYYGKEAGYRNVFTADGGAITYDSGYTPSWQNYFGSPILFGTMEVDPGAGGPATLDFGFCAYTWRNQGSPLGCLSNAQNDTTSQNSFQSIALNVTDSAAWLFWDDSGAGPDDNHDDMLIKATFRPKSTPEPGSLALLGIGLAGLGLGRRRKRA